MSDLIGPDEARVIKNAIKEMRAEPPPTDSGPVGCLLSLLSIVGLVALPWLAPRLGLQGAALTVTIVGLIVTVLGGAVWSVFGGAFSRGAVVGAVEEAVTELIELYPDGPSDRMLALATRIILDAYVSTGPTTTAAYEATEVAERLGPALPYVIRVERYLVEHEGTYTVFTG